MSARKDGEGIARIGSNATVGERGYDIVLVVMGDGTGISVELGIGLWFARCPRGERDQEGER